MKTVYIFLWLLAVVFCFSCNPQDNPETPPKYYAIIFVGEGVNIEPQSIAHGAYATAPENPEREGYDFGGWFTDNGTFANKWDFKTNIVTQNTILYAKWINKYIIYFVGVGVDIEPQSIAHGNYATAPENPEREDYDFGGWFIDDGTFANKWDFNTDIVTQNTILYAKWKNNFLQGTKWKLAGLVDNETGDLKDLGPRRCGLCYLFTFDTDSTASGRITGDITFLVRLEPVVTIVIATLIVEIGDDFLFEAIKSIISYELNKNELKFYYNDGKNYLLFERIPPTSLILTNWKLEGLIDTETGNLKELEPKDCEPCYSFTFNTDSSGFGTTTGNHILVRLRPRPGIFVTTEAGEMGDGRLFHTAVNSIISYELIKNEMKFYYNDGKNYLKFKETGGKYEYQ